MIQLARLGIAFASIKVAPVQDIDPGNPADFTGEWKTTIGVVKLEQDGETVKGTYGDPGQFTLEGTVKGTVLTFSYREGPARGDARWTLDNSGDAFSGTFQI
jgi:hypothetical protein